MRNKWLLIVTFRISSAQIKEIIKQVVISLTAGWHRTCSIFIKTGFVHKQKMSPNSTQFCLYFKLKCGFLLLILESSWPFCNVNWNFGFMASDCISEYCRVLWVFCESWALDSGQIDLTSSFRYLTDLESGIWHYVA